MQPLVYTNQDELSDHFRKFFEDCPLDLEKNAIPFERTSDTAHFKSVLTVPQTATQFNTPPAATTIPSNQSATNAALLLNLDPGTEEALCRTIAGDFYSHTRNRLEYEIKSVHLLRNPLVWRRYQAEKQLRRQLAEQDRLARTRARCNSNSDEKDDVGPTQLFRDEILYHGTQQRRIPSILLNGLDPRMTVRAIYGKGVYFSDSIEKCMQYVDKQTSMDQEYSIILCCVLLGNVLVEPYERSKRNLTQQTMFLPEGYDSAVEQDVFKEWIVFEKSQILPLCVINFTASNNPDSFFRMTAHQVLFNNSSTYPSAITDIARRCTVPTPTDNGHQRSRDELSKSELWRAPDFAFRAMLIGIFDLPGNLPTTQIRNIHFEPSKEWAVRFIEPLSNEEKFFYMSDSSYNTLMELFKNIQVHMVRMENRKQVNRARRTIEENRINSQIDNLPDGQKLIETMALVGPQLHRIQSEGNTITQEIERNKNQLLVSGRGHIIQSHEFRLFIHPLERKLEELKAMHNDLMAQLAPWSRDDLNRAELLLKAKQELQKAIDGELEWEQRQQKVISAEKARSKAQGFSLITTISLQRLESHIRNAKERRELLEKGKSFEMSFRFTDVEIETSSSKVWPQIVAEMLLPVVMMTHLSDNIFAHLNNTSRCSENLEMNRDKEEANGGLRDAGAWWHAAPQALFQEPAAASVFWPIDPRSRLTNRRLILLQDYVEWMFMEKENRTRKRDRRLNQGTPWSNSSLNPTEELLPSELPGFIQAQWDLLDPSILHSIRGLSSRFGTVVFDRKKRLEELAQMGNDLLSNLFVDAEYHMLMGDRQLSSGSSGTQTSSTLPPVECPICQEALELPDPNSSSLPTTAAHEKVVKLKGCRHCFHEECIKQWFQSKDAQLKCPMCNTLCTTEAKAGVTKNALGGRPQKLGPSPDAVMGYSFDVRLCCYFIYIIIPSHEIEDPEYPNRSARPRTTIHTDIRYAIVPFSARLGPLLMIRLIALFYYGHLFRVGRSITRNVDNVVTWNGIHLRTSLTGQYGFPAPNFERNCWQEINQKGIAMGLEELVLGMPQSDGSMSAAVASTLDPQALNGIALPAEILAELAAEEMVVRIFHENRPLLFT
ncbi:putative E3 ubiquitin-protein ligase dtx2 [Lobosporangium transversale]|uniref:RING-type domain-containing protein n=1 Tax=Lobosporangium transversale TaxID=64571 RepID=A0A1Y2GAP8_9FUNG|nr:hypothetical protein BCR41DRAFT_425406 [Lobosporangium transversale]KAF9910477.1 putative E3 ubiquitin-protein ligase dtx2 [Lobosporangium transversale]ORZ05719.1 hypothetical protein BCR41DRAFT_425406 [Lobosporangium transversale]|eukprot:XP_021877206.1 hypothetical protein BCR41DRAFT_425406 [Lobosporangium transversale]